jgi:2-methylisocitrate lyase-like PEP mutase family enzyme
MDGAMTALDRKADIFRALHRPGDPAILPTVWDAWSADLAVTAGFPALTVGSHPVSDSLGRADGEGMTFSELLTRVRQITDAVEVPVSVDIESGYGLEPAQLIEGLLDAGAVGLNIEDTVHSQGNRLRSGEEHADLVHSLRKVSDAAGVHVVLNARTDYLLGEHGDPLTRVAVTIARLRLAAAAGADVLYPVGRYGENTQRTLVEELPLPVNATAHPGVGDRAKLAELGVARVSFGPFLQRALGDEAIRLLARWT